jgi:hypothetical protein
MNVLDRKRLGATVTAATLLVGALCNLAAQAQDVAPDRKPLFIADQEACFGRVYDRAHLARHPNQKVSSLHIFRYLDQRPEAENWRPNERQEANERFRKTGQTWVQAFVRFRDRPGYFHNWLVCSGESNKGVHCFVECDGGTFDMNRESPTTALLYNHSFVVVGGCGQEVEGTDWVYFSPGEDDRVFELESMPVAACRVEEQKAMPIRPWKLLRERFRQDDVFCFGRDYDAAHLAKHPQQQVASIRVGRLAPEKEWLYPTRIWPVDVQLAVSLNLKAASARRDLQYVCRPQEASWRCTAVSGSDARSSCGNGTVYLARGPDDDIMLINPQDGLPIEAACQAKAEIRNPSPDDFQRRETRSDDKTFRLSRMPIEACR